MQFLDNHVRNLYLYFIIYTGEVLLQFSFLKEYIYFKEFFVNVMAS